VKTVLRMIRIRKFLGLLDPDPLVRGTDPDPSIVNFLSLRNYVNVRVPSKSKKQKNSFLLASLSSMTK
jgi:hypothetical protein